MIAPSPVNNQEDAERHCRLQTRPPVERHERALVQAPRVRRSRRHHDDDTVTEYDPRRSERGRLRSRSRASLARRKVRPNFSATR